MKTPTPAELKFGFTDLVALILERDQILATHTEIARLERLQAELSAERTRLLGTGEFEDTATLQELSAVQLKLDLIPAKLRQLQERLVELERKVMAESTARFSDLHREASAVRAAHRKELEAALARVIPRSVDYRDGVTGKVTRGADTSRFDRAVDNLIEVTEITRLVNHATTPISYTDNAAQRVDMVLRGARLLVQARKLLGHSQEIELVEVA